MRNEKVNTRIIAIPTFSFLIFHSSFLISIDSSAAFGSIQQFKFE